MRENIGQTIFEREFWGDIFWERLLGERILDRQFLTENFWERNFGR